MTEILTILNFTMGSLVVLALVGYAIHRAVQASRDRAAVLREIREEQERHKVSLVAMNNGMQHLVQVTQAMQHGCVVLTKEQWQRVVDRLGGGPSVDEWINRKG